MASPVDHLRECDPQDEGDADHEQRVRGRRLDAVSAWGQLRGPRRGSARARGDQARPEQHERLVSVSPREQTQNIVVLQSDLGSAPAIARALDRIEHPLVVGTIAGDDTMLVIARSTADAKALADELGG